MPSSRLMTLGGLGASATAAVAGPGATLGTGGVAVDNSYKSTLFTGLTENSKNLYQTFNLDCVKGIFPSLKADLREQTESTVDPDSFTLPQPGTVTPGAAVKACLRVDFSYFTKDSKGALIAKVELAASKGDHGVILLNSITNALKNGGYGFDYRAIFLKQEQGSWNVKGGTQWQDTVFMGDGNGIPEKLDWGGIVDDLKHKKTYWNGRLCAVSEDCDRLLLDSEKETYEKTFDWSTGTSGNIYQGLKIEAPNAGYGVEYQDFWNGKESPISDISTVDSRSSNFFVNGSWKKSQPGKSCCGTRLGFKNWFEIFKGDKGAWKARTT